MHLGDTAIAAFFPVGAKKGWKDGTGQGELVVRLSKPFIRLPFRFDAERLAAEVAQFAEADWMPHPNDLPGNSAIASFPAAAATMTPLRARSSRPPNLTKCPYMQQVMARLRRGAVPARA